jgi:hypothetical protein
LVCSDLDERCQVITSAGRFLYRDRNHWSYEGRKIFGKSITDTYPHLFVAPS